MCLSARMLKNNSAFSFLCLVVALDALLILTLSCSSSQDIATHSFQKNTIAYTRTNADFPNPERGMYYLYETHSTNFTSLNSVTLQELRQNENITLILRLYYLDDFLDTDISQDYLNAMQSDFDALRNSRIKAILRFAYTNEYSEAPPYGDATKERILKHLKQLRPVLHANSDVIALMQAGFIGVWGEWYYTDHFVQTPSDPGNVTTADYVNRRDVLIAILNTLPESRMVQVRTPRYKANIVSDSAGYFPILLNEAHNGKTGARVGYHNDCFLASEKDFGTFIDRTQEDPFLELETKYLPMGGETCALNPPRSECGVAMEELARFHWSFLSGNYHPDVLASWSTKAASHNCFDEVKQRLGYRLSLMEGIYQDETNPGGEFTVEIKIANHGWAAPFNPRMAELLLRNTANGEIYRVELPEDPRFWIPENENIYSLKHTICTPHDMQTGKYELLLNLPDPEPSLHIRSEYSIRLANKTVWEESTGYNNLLHKININETLTDTACTSSLKLEKR